MRALVLTFALAVSLGACSEREVRLQGTVAAGWTGGPLFVSTADRPEPLAIQDGAFAIAGIPAGPVDLRIRSDSEEIARMDIGTLPEGTELSLERIRIREERGLAFPSAIRAEGVDMVTINGIRIADPEALPNRVEANGVVLAISEDADALVVRPQGQALPDLSVVVTPATLVTGTPRETASLDGVSAGDSVRVEGRTESGYLYAERVTLTDARPAGGPIPGRAERIPGERSPAPEPQEERKKASADESRGKREKRPASRRASERASPKIPKGHRPPPGECRDWNPNLPPGQQPPPRKC